MTDEFYAVAIPEQRQILGLPLKPLSLGHLILLHRLKSSFVCEGKPGYEDLAIGALICSLSYEDGLQAINDPETPKFLKLLAEKITGIRDWTVSLGFRRPRAIDIHANVEAFSNYIREGSSIPYYSYTPGDFKDIECPSVQIVKVTLMRDMKFSETEILNRSWALCLWDFVTLRALKGEVQMVERDEVKNAQNVADRLAELVKKGVIKAP